LRETHEAHSATLTALARAGDVLRIRLIRMGLMEGTLTLFPALSEKEEVGLEKLF
jgi:hypothetical protein